MDSFTQAALGAAVGEAVLGRKVGGRAALWGAVGGTIPDLDVLADPFLTEMQALAFHRGPTHSLLFSLVTAPLFGYALYRLYQWRGGLGAAASWREWTVLMFLALFTHPVLDAFTVYGTQLFWPFSTYPISFDNLFIIDPLYTAPLTLGLFLALFTKRAARRRRWVNGLGLGLSTAYVLFTLVNKAHVHGTFEAELARQGLAYERLMTTPMPFTNALWMGLAHSGDEVYTGLYSVFDDDDRIAFTPIETNRALLEPVRDTPAAQRLLWFSKGWYRMVEDDGALLLHDLRFGRLDGWLGQSDDYVFTFELVPDPPARPRGFQQRPPPLDALGTDRLRELLDRTLGD